ncbi:anthranilate phosphoribosyltransferase [Spirochaetota bacterium]
MDIQESIKKVIDGQDLTQKEAEATMNCIMSGEATDAQIAGFLVALRLKGETVDEITAFAQVMRSKATHIKTSNDLVQIDRDEINIDRETIIDTCGTGGGGTNTFNISTATAFVVSGAGIKVAKHGNKAVSSQCGSADVLTALGVNINLEPDKVGECIQKIGIGFLYAPMLHGAMKYAIGPRRQLGIRTVFNILGPLTNPANANAQIMGVYDSKWVEPLANVLKNLGVKRAFVVHGEGVIDEISTVGTTKVAEVDAKNVKTYEVSPKDYKIDKAGIEDLRGGTPLVNADIIRDILGGEKSPKRDIVVLNAGFALYAGGKAKDVSGGIALAEDSIDSGKAKEKLQQLVEMTNK